MLILKIIRACLLTTLLASLGGNASARFVGVDPAEFKEDNIHSFNRYVYGNNNPYRYGDPDGREAVVHESLQPAVNFLRANSPVFNTDYNKLDQSKAIYKILPMTKENPSTWFLKEPAEGKQIIPGTYTIGISPGIEKWKYLGQDGEKHSFSLERAIAHEVAHPALGSNNEKKVIGHENDVMNQAKPSSPARDTSAPYPVYKPD